ncbi:hypothetical protein MMC30_006693 [Trapelia coarctata]|nr:hypothetical protein [Trapelia coarctata]
MLGITGITDIAPSPTELNMIAPLPMAQRPIIIQSRFLRDLCPPQRRTRSFASFSPTATSTTRAWSLPPTAPDIADDQVARLAHKPLHNLTLSDLVRHGRPPLSQSALLSSASFSLSLIPIRLAHRIQALRNLPFIVVSNPHISRIYSNYLHSLSTLLPYHEQQISTLEEEARFTEVMADLVQTHANTIPVLARGFLECRKYISPEAVTRFLDEHLRARIGTRLIAEQHIALHLSSQPRAGGRPASLSNATLPPQQDQHGKVPTPPSTYIGVIDTHLRPATIIRHCESFVSELCELKYGVRPSLTISGAADTTLAHVPTHVEYILTELLKNAFRATVESGNERNPVEVTIAKSHAPALGGTVGLETGEGSAGARLEGEAEVEPTSVTIRIRDRGGGISPSNLPHIWGYSFTTFSEEDVPGAGGAGVGNGRGGAGRGAGNGRGGAGGYGAGNGTIDALNTLSASGGEGSSLAGLGYGLPLGRAYAEYFGGGIAVQSLWGWGTDVFLRLRGLGGG